MRSKGAITVFAIILTIVCVYQLSFTLVSRSVEKDAREHAAGDLKAERAYLDSMASQPVYNLLFKNFTFAEVRENQINLGLDLKGGMNVTLEVSLTDLIKALSNHSPDSTFLNSLADAEKLQRHSQEDYVTLFGKAFAQRNPNGRLASIFATKEMQGRVSLNSTNDEVLAVIRSESNDAIDRSFNILRTRIDKFGVTQPNIQRLAGGRILIELPGIKEPERVRKLLQGTAKLEFWETYESKDILEHLSAVDKLLSRKMGGAKKDTLKSGDVAETKAKEETVSADTAKSSSLLETVASAEEDTSDAGKLSSQLQENPLFSILSPAVYTDENGQTFARPGPVAGFAAIKDTSKVNEMLSQTDVRQTLPKDVKFAWSVKPVDKAGVFLELIALKITSRDGRPPLEGDVITDARQDFGQFNNSPEVLMGMNAEGAKIWKRMTAENIGRSVAIVLDNYVYSYPTVQGEIPNGRSSITGRFTIEEAKDLANVLKAGKLPAPARIVQEAIVGPSLGREAVNSGLLSFIIALGLVLVFMVFYYSNAGWVANLALLANVFFILGVLASLTAALTLPGIAGIVLTIGMSVDANILIYERIREEIANGKGPRLAIADGFRNAYSSIIDSNVTTLLTGIILYTFGTGPIQGFATTLIIGILTSLFSAIFLTRLVFEWLLSKNKSIHFSTKLTENAFKRFKFDFVGKRKMYYVFSSVLIVIALGSIFTRGFNLGVDFKGGRTYVVRFEENPSTSDIRKVLTTSFGGAAPEVKTFKSFASADQVKITTTYHIDDNSADADDYVESKLSEGLASLNAGTYEVLSSQKVGPTIADDIKISAAFAVFFSILVIFIYILLRFKKWQYSLGAVIALAHDVLIILGIFSLFHGILPFSMEIDQAFIAAILTVLGYSINDTVVVFDRIREYLGMHLRKQELNETINEALNATLSRTINTGLTVFFVLFAIFVFGGEVIRGFSFALMLGVIVGTYSSICIATPIMADFRRKQQPVPSLT